MSYYSDLPEEKKAAIRAKAREYYWANRENQKEGAKLRSRKYYEANRAAVIARSTAYHATNRDKARESVLEWQRRNPAKCAARSAARRAGVNQATPKWVDREDLQYVYDMAALFKVTVDHIHPLKGKNFSGLHVPWNLQLMPGPENSAKGNRFVGI